MKKLIVLAVLGVIVTGFAAAGGLVFHAGAGYHSSYIGELPDDVASEVKALPLGVGGYAGLGYGFGANKKLSLGAEFAPSWDLALKPIGVSNFNYQVRGFAKFKPLDMLTLTGFGGYAGDILSGGDIDSLKSNGNAVVGARLTVLFLYAEYGMVVPWDFSDVYKHEIGLGFAFFK